ncbi:MAG: hypothetical protein JWL72_1934 [Ilumatobacteraceae bacterium]|nr:hypothetical protein [Ilumatobacteraceae bacterium]
MSFPPPRFDPRAVADDDEISSVRPLHQARRNLRIVGALAVVVAGLAAASYAKQTPVDTPDRIVFIGGIVFAALGGLLALRGLEIGAPIAAGAVTPFIGFAAVLIGVRIDLTDALDAVDAKLLVGAGVIGIIVAMIGMSELTGRSVSSVGAVIAVLGFVPVVAFGAIIRLDRFHDAPIVVAFVGQVLIGAVIVVGGPNGRFGSLGSVVAAGLLLPFWVERVRHIADRKAFAVGAVVALIAVVVLGLVAFVGANIRDDDRR